MTNLSLTKVLLVVVLIFVGIGAVVGYMMLTPGAPPPPPKRIGIINNTIGLEPVYEGFKQGMAELGYVEGRDVVYDYTLTKANVEVTKEAAKRYVSENVDLILAITGLALEPAYNETMASGNLIPIIFTNSVTALQQGFIKSYQSSGNHVTGIVPNDVAVSVKKLGFLQQINPNAKIVGVFHSAVPSAKAVVEKLKEEAKRFGMTITSYLVTGSVGPESIAKLRQITETIQSGDIDAIMTIPEPLTNTPEATAVLLDLAKRLKVPTLFLNIKSIGVLAYQEDVFGNGKQAAIMADKILKGTKPTDIPIEFPKKTLLMVNPKLAEEIGITIPNSLLEIADQVIK